MTIPKNPYQLLSAEHFWSSGVCNRAGEDYEEFWTPRFDFDTSTKFATAGSCFAQHIGTWLRKNGYQWLSPVTSPGNRSVRPAGDAALFSFQTGNIYTAAMLKQWVFWALGLASPPEELFSDEEAFYDPFVSYMSQRAFGSVSELYEARRSMLEDIKSVIAQTDVFIFTLGLTEGWVNKAGHAYPSCPGTSRGVYDPAQHRFVNYSFAHIENDLNETFDAMKGVNPAVRFLLTVSPVPLTATAGEDHVLVATTYSKSVLRAVAGQLRNTRDDVDYFPSYELISAVPERGRHFEKNLRSVTPSGVAFVMAHFANSVPEDIAAGREEKRISIVETNEEIDDALCDDLLLEKWQRNAAPTDPMVCLIGDSHMEKLANALSSIGVEAMGGKIMNGSAWCDGQLELHDSEIFVPLEDDVARDAWKKALPFFSGASMHRDRKPAVITNLCMHTHKTVPEFLNAYHSRHGNLDYNEASMSEYFFSRFEKHLQIIRRLLRDGFDVVVVTDPPTQVINDNFRPFSGHFENYDRLAEKLLSKEGCTVFNSRTTFCRPDFPNELFSDIRYDGVRDYIHGSDLFYRRVAQSLRQALWPEAA